MDFLRSLAPGSVAQLDDGSLTVCEDVAEAERCFDERTGRVTLRASDLASRGWTRLAATLNN